MIDGNKLGDVGFQYLGIPYSEMDCQAFVEKCLSDCGIKKDLSGSNAWFREVHKNGIILTPEDCVKQFGCVPKGAFLFILKHDGKEPEKYKADGMGNASHIGICTIPKGEGAINSSSSRGCVAESKFKQKSINGGWNRVGLWNLVSYDYGGYIPKPVPIGKTAIVGNVAPDRRQDVNFRTRPTTNATLIEQIPCGETVEVLSDDGEWSKICWNGQTGYMMSKFLIYDSPVGEHFCVTIHDLSKELAEEIVNIYGGSISKEVG